MYHRACSQRNESRSKSHFGTWFEPFPDLKAWFYPMWMQSSFTSGYWNTLLKRNKIGVSDHDPRRKPDSGEMWTQSSFGTWFVRVHFGNVRWSHAWVNQRRLHSRNKILPRSAQILFVIRTAFAMHVNARSSNHQPNQEADRDPKRLSERDSFLCEQAHCLTLESPQRQAYNWWQQWDCNSHNQNGSLQLLPPVVG